MAGRDIVQEFDPGSVRDQELLSYSRKVRAEIEEYGIAKPKGYTVSWHCNPAVEQHHYGSREPMKPWRLTLTRSLIMSYGMHSAMDVYISRAATTEEVAAFHADEYIEFLQRVTPGNLKNFAGVEAFNIGGDCPVFDGLWDFCTIYAGASIDAARKICNNQSDIAINWSGGLHHAMKDYASGFCYVNDIVLAILQLLRYHPRVLYIDIDVHHGDGVERAFWSTDRVMTLSFHKYDPERFFPGTGPLDSTGPEDRSNLGRHHSVNVPLLDGIEDAEYIQLFQDIVTLCTSAYRPTAIVLQCGADSLGYDRLGSFNLTVKGHGACVEFIKRLKIPLLVLGGGGYTPRNVARAWCYETSICIGAELHQDLPQHTPYLAAFAPDHSLFPKLDGGYANKNRQTYLRNIVEKITEQMRNIEHAPSVQMQRIPPDLQGIMDEVEEELKALEMERTIDKEKTADPAYSPDLT
ncbi:hypothetical protein B7463_g7744, partial [Scytalidium lignicola]